MRASYSSIGTDKLFNTEQKNLLVRASYSSVRTDTLFDTETHYLTQNKIGLVTAVIVVQRQTLFNAEKTLFNTKQNRLLVRASYSSIETDTLFNTERH